MEKQWLRSAYWGVILTIVGTVIQVSQVTEALAQSQDSTATSATNPSTASPANSEQETCVPSCRKGFVCVKGSCVSSCNPPCAADEICTPNAECIAKGPPTTKSHEGTRFHDEGHFSSRVRGEGSSTTAVDDDRSSDEDRAASARQGLWTHDGLYFRLAFGFGWLAGKTTYDSGSTFHAENTLSGFSVMDEIALGGSPVPGFVVGGGLFSSTAPAPGDQYSSQYNDASTGAYASTIGDLTAPMISAYLLGPFVDVYPIPRRGFHLEGAVGLNIVTSGTGGSGQTCTATMINGTSSRSCRNMSSASSHTDAGFGALLGAGYEGWVSEQWSLGGMVRIHCANGPLGSSTLNAAFPGMLFTATYN